MPTWGVAVATGSAAFHLVRVLLVFLPHQMATGIHTWTSVNIVDQHSPKPWTKTVKHHILFYVALSQPVSREKIFIVTSVGQRLEVERRQAVKLWFAVGNSWSGAAFLGTDMHNTIFKTSQQRSRF